MSFRFKISIAFFLLASFSCQPVPEKNVEEMITGDVAVNFMPGLPPVSFRGIFATNTTTIYVSGQKGNIWKTTNAGKNWLQLPAPDNDSLDFRDIEVIEDSILLIMSAGFPCKIYRSLNGGNSWNEVYSNPDSLAFLDGMDFNENGFGIVFGDVLNGSFLVLTSENKGEVWHPLPAKLLPAPLNMEAGFAASGSSVQLLQNKIFIGTGGDTARLIKGDVSVKPWKVQSTPMMNGAAGRGIYSLAFKTELSGIAVGGAWNEDSLYNSVILTRDGGKHWQLAEAKQDYRSSVAYLGNYTYLACGPKGLDISRNDGKNWERLSQKPFHSIYADSLFKVAFVVGNSGILGKIQL